MTPLQKAAQAVIDRWDSPNWKDQQHTAEYIAELRKALDAEIAQAETVDRNLRVTAQSEQEQAVEPVAWTVTVGDDFKNCIEITHCKDNAAAQYEELTTGGFESIYRIRPLYLHPPQTQGTTPVPESYVLVSKETLIGMKDRVNTLATLSLKAERYSVGISIKQTIADILAAAQGEKP